MQFLKTLLIVFTVALAVAFAFNNWDNVPVRLWGGLLIEINLPLLMLLCFLAGIIPTWLWQRAIRWRMAQRLAVSERTVSDLRTAAAAMAALPATLDADPLPVTSAPPLIDEQRP